MELTVGNPCIVFSVHSQVFGYLEISSTENSNLNDMDRDNQEDPK
jgi:hypothetical protein